MFQDRFPWTNIHELNLDWILKHFKEFLLALDELEEWKAQHQEEYEQLKQLYDDIVDGNFPPAMIEALEDWMRRNALSLVGQLVKMVFFELSDDGYFVAHIPDQWDAIRFATTGLDIIIPGYDYGHLVIQY